MKVYITKYALTQGIMEFDSDYAEKVHIDKDGYLHLQIKRDDYPEFYNPKNYALNWEDAIEQAENMRQKKITSLKKQIKKLEKMKFKED